MGKIWVIADYREGKFHAATGQLIAFAQQMKERKGGVIELVVLGSVEEASLETVKSYAIDRMVILEHENLAFFSPTPAISALQEWAKADETPEWVFTVHTHRYYDFNTKLAVAWDCEPMTGVTRVTWDDTGPVFLKEVFYDKFVLRMRATGNPPHVVSFQPGTFSVDKARTGGVSEVIRYNAKEVPLGRRKHQAYKRPERKGVGLTNADIIVAVGRGIGKKENLSIIQELADMLGAAVGSSRPIVDAGWLPYEHQIGSSGVMVAPRLYIGIGISGAMQHTVGMKNSRVIVAINKDREAPIFNVAHYGIAEDLFKVVPALIKKLKELHDSGGL